MTQPDEIAQLEREKAELLEAFEAFIAHSVQFFEFGKVGGEELAILNRARAAIAKATK